MMLGRDMPDSPVVDGQVLALHRLADEVEDGLDGDAARDFARVVAAHAVGQHQQADVGVEGDGVLVVLAYLAGVGQADEAKLGAQAQMPRPATDADHNLDYEMIVTTTIRPCLPLTARSAAAYASIARRTVRAGVHKPATDRSGRAS